MRLKLTLGYYLLLLTSSLPKSAPCQTLDGVYRGTLGKQEIVLEIGADPEQPDLSRVIGRYFYRRYGIGISLKGSSTKDGSFLLTEYHAWKNTGGQWKLKFQHDAATGSFCKCDLAHAAKPPAELLPVQLKRISSGFDSAFDPFVSEAEIASAPDHAYYDLLMDFPLTAGPEVLAKSGFAYLMVADSRFKVSMPRITRFPDRSAMTKVNNALEKELAHHRLRAAECLQGLDFNGEEFDVVATVELFTRHLLSVVRQGNSFCGGAHPNHEMYVNTYNLDSGVESSVEDLLDGEMDSAAIRKLIGSAEGVGKEAISRLVAELYFQRYEPNTEDCRDVIRRNENDGALAFATLQYFSDHGLVVTPELPHVAMACADPVVIPYREFRPFLRKNSQLFSLVELTP
jgi:hypothetical protein